MEVKRNLGKVKIKENPYGGYMWIDVESPEDDLTIIVEVEQAEQCITEEGTEERMRKGNLEGTLEQILIMDWKPCQPITGKIQVIETFDPPIPHHPESFRVWLNVEVVRVQGKPVYHLEVFQRDMRKQDILIDYI